MAVTSTMPAEPLKAYTPKQIAVAMEKQDVVMEARELMATQSYKTRKLRALARRRGIHLCTIYEWLKAYSELGVKGLAPQLRKKPSQCTGQIELPVAL